MRPVDDLPARLRSEMLAYTALDVPPEDLAERVWRLSARRRRRQAVVAGGVPAVLVLAVVLLLGPDSPSSSPDRLAAQGRLDVSLLVLAGGSPGFVDVETSPRGLVERVELPAYVRNNGSEPIMLREISIAGTALTETFEDRILAPGGRQPLSFEHVLDCARQTTPPADPRLELRISTSAGEHVLTLDVPNDVLALYRLAPGCSDESLRSAREAEQERDGATADE